MKINETNNILENCKKIESFLLDFEQFPQTDVLMFIREELFIVSEKMRKFFHLRNINSLINEFIFTVSAAVEKIIVLNIKDIDLLLRINDLILNTCELEYNNINDLLVLTTDVSGGYIDNIKKINYTIPLKKRTSYLSYESIRLEPKAKTNPTLTAQTVQRTDKNIKEKIKTQPTKEEIPRNVVVEQIKKEKETPNVKNFAINEIAQLVAVLENSINNSKEKNLTITDEQIKLIQSTSVMLRNLASNSSIELIDEANQQFDVIDNFISKLQEFTDNNYDDNTVTEEDYSKLKLKSIKKNITFSDAEFLMLKCINLNEVLNFKEKFRDSIASISYELTQIQKNINAIYLSPNESNHNFDKFYNETKITINKNNELLNKFDNLISEKFSLANSNSKEIFDKLYEITSKPFSSFTLGLSEFANAVAESVKKEVEVIVNNQDVLVPVDLWLIFENIIPAVIRHIIICNIFAVSDKPKNKQKILLNITSVTGIIEITFNDNGKFFEVEKQIQLLKETIIFVQNNGGKAYLNSNESSGNTIKFKFQLENIISNFQIIETNNQYYAIPLNFCDFINEKNEESFEISLASLYDKTKTKITKNAKFILLKWFNSKIKLYCDEVIGDVFLSPKRLSGALATIPFSIGASQFGDKSVLILDVESIYQHLKKNEINKNKKYAY